MRALSFTFFCKFIATCCYFSSPSFTGWESSIGVDVLLPSYTIIPAKESGNLALKSTQPWSNFSGYFNTTNRGYKNVLRKIRIHVGTDAVDKSIRDKQHNKVWIVYLCRTTVYVILNPFGLYMMTLLED